MTILFPDVSHYQVGLRLTAAANAVIAKATEGTSFVDSSYLDFKNQAAALNIPFCAYHWVNTADLTDQAVHARRIAGTTPMMWDAEAPGATVPRLVELTARYRSLGGVVHLVYLPRWWWADHLGSPDLTPLVDAGLSLVSSNYPATGYAPNGRGWDAYGGMTPVQWQYTNARAFGGRLIDFNAFKGSAAEWAALITGGTNMPLTTQDLAAVTNVVWHSDMDSGPRSISAGTALLATMDRVARLEVKLDAVLTALGAIGSGTSTDVAAVLAGVDASLAALRIELDAEVRDAVADLGEGGAAQVRAPQV